MIGAYLLVLIIFCYSVLFGVLFVALRFVRAFVRVSGSEYSSSEPEESPRPSVLMVVVGNSFCRRLLRWRVVWSASG